MISYYVPPASASASHRVYGFANFLAKSGCEVHLLVPPNPHSPFPSSSYSWHTAIQFVDKRPSIQKTDVAKVSMQNWKFKVPMLDRGLFWAIRTKFKVKRICREISPDVVITTVPPFSSIILAPPKGMIWVLDIRDFFYSGHLDQRQSWIFRFYRWIEARMIRKATAVSMVSSNMVKLLSEQYPLEKSKFNSFETVICPARHQSRQSPVLIRSE